eukprot:UN20756
MLLNGLNWERSLIHFLIFLLENRKNAIRSLQTFFGSLRRFLHSLHSFRSVPFRSFRKVVRDPKSLSRTKHFSVLSSEKKLQRTFSILKAL